MPRNTIQIRLMRMRISDHSAGCSRTNRVTIWNMPRLAATTIIAQATAMAKAVVQRSSLRKASLMRGVPEEGERKRPESKNSRALPRSAAGRLLDGADLVEVGLAELLLEFGVHRRERLHELGLVDVVDHGHALGAQVGHALGVVLVHAGAVGLGAFLGGAEEGLLVGGAQLVERRLVHQEQAGRVDVAGQRQVLLH